VTLSAPSGRGVRLPIHWLFGLSTVMLFVLSGSVRLAKSFHQSELVVTARSSTMRVRGSLKEGGHRHAA
jgi:hypothetical protein